MTCRSNFSQSMIRSLLPESSLVASSSCRPRAAPAKVGSPAPHHKSAIASAQGPGIVLVLRQVLLEALQRVAHPALDRVLGYARDAGDVLEREVGDLAQE